MRQISRFPALLGGDRTDQAGNRLLIGLCGLGGVLLLQLVNSWLF